MHLYIMYVTLHNRDINGTRRGPCFKFDTMLRSSVLPTRELRQSGWAWVEFESMSKV